MRVGRVLLNVSVTPCELLMEHEEVVYAVGDMVENVGQITNALPEDPWDSSSSKPNDWKIDWNEEDPRGNNWGLEAIQASSAWDYDNKFGHIDIGIVDSAFDVRHEDLKNKIQLVPDWMNDINSSSENETKEHGTHVTGILGAEANNKKGITGIVWDSTVYGVSLADVNSEDTAFARVVAGLRYCVESGAKVVNFSLGLTGTFENGVFELSDEKMQKHGRTMAVIMQQLLQEEHDFIAVQSSGNGTDSHTDPDQRIAIDAVNSGWFASVTSDKITLIDNRFSKKDILDRIIIVGNAKRNEDGNYQQHVSSNGGSRVDICAPGTEIYSTVPNNSYASVNWTGTSMSAPMVTGVAALVWSVNPNFDGMQVKEIVCAKRNTKYKVYDNPDGKHPLFDEYASAVCCSIK